MLHPCLACCLPQLCCHAAAVMQQLWSAKLKNLFDANDVYVAGRAVFLARHAAGPVTKTISEAEGRDIVVIDTPGATLQKPHQPHTCYYCVIASQSLPGCALSAYHMTQVAAGLGQSGRQAEEARQEVVKALCSAAQRGGRLAIALVTSVVRLPPLTLCNVSCYLVPVKASPYLCIYFSC